MKTFIKITLAIAILFGTMSLANAKSVKRHAPPKHAHLVKKPHVLDLKVVIPASALKKRAPAKHRRR